MNTEKIVLLSFDVEEFDMPLEYGHLMSTDEQLSKGFEGLTRIRESLDKLDVTATLFTTATFALHFPSVIRDLSYRHEIASHTFHHSLFKPKDLAASKERIENVTGQTVNGLRMPRMKILPAQEIAAAGYLYDASINPVWLPGRYNNLTRPRTVFSEGSLIRIPASSSVRFRIPLFWLSFKNFPYSYYRRLLTSALNKDGYVSLYFHPWEFIDLTRYKLPGYSKKPSGEKLLKKLEQLLTELKQEASFERMDHFAMRHRILDFHSHEVPLPDPRSNL